MYSNMKSPLVLRDELALFPLEVSAFIFPFFVNCFNLKHGINTPLPPNFLSQMIFEKVFFSFVKETSDLLVIQWSFLTSSMCSIYSDSTCVKGANSTTFLTGKMNAKVLPKCHEMSYIKDIKVEVSLSHAHRELHKVNLNIQLVALQILPHVWVLLMQGWKMRGETFEHLQKSLYIRSVLGTTSMSESILNNVRARSYSRFANRYHHYVHVQMLKTTKDSFSLFIRQ